MDGPTIAAPRSAAEPWFQKGMLNEFGLALPALAVLVLFLLVPLTFLLVRSLTDPTPGFGNYIDLLSDPTYTKVLSNTFIVAGVVTTAALVIGFPVAWLLVILPSQASRWIFAIILISMWTNLLARTYAWMVLLQQSGIINRLLMSIGLINSPLPLIHNIIGVTIGMTYIMLPFVVMPLYANISSIDPALMQAASICGARPTQVFLRVLLPLALPGAGAAGLMVFTMALGYFITPAMLGGTESMMLGEMIVEYVQSLLQWGLGSAAAFILLAATLTLYAVYARLFGLSPRT